jgi:hypothetical protein
MGLAVSTAEAVPLSVLTSHAGSTVSTQQARRRKGAGREPGRASGSARRRWLLLREGGGRRTEYKRRGSGRDSAGLRGGSEEHEHQGGRATATAQGALPRAGMESRYHWQGRERLVVDTRPAGRSGQSVGADENACAPRPPNKQDKLMRCRMMHLLDAFMLRFLASRHPPAQDRLSSRRAQALPVTAPSAEAFSLRSHAAAHDGAPAPKTRKSIATVFSYRCI